MTLEDMQKIAGIIGFADGGNRSCVSDLLGRLGRAFPEFCFWIDGEEAHADGARVRVAVAQVGDGPAPAGATLIHDHESVALTIGPEPITKPRPSPTCRLRFRHGQLEQMWMDPTAEGWLVEAWRPVEEVGDE